MKNSKAVVLTMLALVVGQAWAVSVSEQEAAFAASAWAGSGEALGVNFDRRVGSTEKIVTDDGDSFYVVRMRDGRVIFLSSDTESEPIVAFSANPDLDFSKGTKLRDLLSRDAHARAALRARSATVTAAASGDATSAPAQTAVSKWAALLGKATPSAMTSVSSGLTGSADPVSSVSDMRRAPLIQSKWSQNQGGGGYCWDYYTPNHIACGCTATAAAQIMRYFTYPTQEMPQRTYTCTVEGVEKDLTTKGGVYDWANMPLVLSGTVSDKKREAIGRLTYDIGVTLKTSYEAKSGGGASPQELGRLYRAFNYANGYVFWDGKSYSTGEGGLHVLALREKIIYANLDAKRPVQLAIYGYPKGHVGDMNYWTGHSVVGDGYGFKDIAGIPTAFVHINMGWAGSDDMWYNIPEINAANSGSHVGDSGHDFLYMGGAAFNLFTDKAGLEIMSGRVLDDDGKPVSGATVRAKDPDGDTVAELTTDDKGIYAFELPGGVEYAISAVSADGLAISDLDPKLLRKTEGNGDLLVDSAMSVGNSWGNDLVLAPPAARIGDKVFSTLEKALTAAREMKSPLPVEIEILLPILFREPFDIDFDCRISATDEMAACAVTRTRGASFNVTAGGRLSLSNVLFAAASETVVDVAAGGVLELRGDVDFGVDTGVAAVTTADKDGFVLAGLLTRTFALACATAKDVGQFGQAVCASEIAAAGVSKIVDWYDEYGEIGGTVAEDMSLVWGARQVSPDDDDAVGYYVAADGSTNCYARLDRLLERFAASQADGTLPASAELVLMKGGPFSRRIFVGSDLTVVGRNDLVLSNLTAAAGFTVTNGTLTVRNLTFAGYTGPGIFEINGCELVLGAGAVIRDCLSTSDHSAAVNVRKGTLTMLDGAEIADCGYAKTTQGEGKGGGVTLGEGCRFDMLGGRITGCSAKTYGGGVYADRASTMKVSGSATVKDNTHWDKSASDDVYLVAKPTSLCLAGALTGEIGVRASQTAGLNGAGKVFASVGNGVSATAVLNSLPAFFNDVNGELVADYDSGAKTVVWAVESTDPKQVDPAEAVVEIVYPGAASEYYATLNDAFTALSGDATIRVRADTWFVSGIEVPYAVRFESDPGNGPFTVSRAGNVDITVVEGGALTVADLQLKGTATIGETECAGETALLRVYGGSLTLDAGAVVSDVRGGKTRDVSGVVVWEGGTFTLKAGAAIRDCVNTLENPGDGSGCGSGLLVDGKSRAYLRGGSITGCQALRGGVCVANESTISVSGAVVLSGNTTLSGEDCNMIVHRKSELFLDGAFSGNAGMTTGIYADPVAFGEVTVKLGFAALTNSAANFHHDVTGAYGMAVTNATSKKTYLVWSRAIGKDGSVTVTKDGVSDVFWCVGDIPENTVVVPVQPFVVTAFDGTEGGPWTLTLAPGTEWCKYTLYTREDLMDAWTPIGEPKVLGAADIGPDGSFIFTADGTEAKRFWQVRGEDGEKPAGK